MTVKTSPAPAAGKIRKVLMQMVLGAVSGGVAMFAVMWSIDRPGGLIEDPSRIYALGVALVYGLMAALIGLGLAAPQLGAKTLNVEDADELTEQRPNLLVGAGMFALVAILLAGLALGPGDPVSGPLSASAALILSGGAGAGLVLLSVAYRKRGDEMMRAVSHEASSWAIGLVLLVFGGWAIATQFAGVTPFTPITFLAGFFTLYLVAVFIAVGKRGMLLPR